MIAVNLPANTDAPVRPLHWVPPGLVLELQAGGELVENHATFRALGFTKVAETVHPGDTRPTSITIAGG